MKKIISILFICLLLVGCSNNQAKLDNEYSKMVDDLDLKDYKLEASSIKSIIFPDQDIKGYDLTSDKCKFFIESPLDDNEKELPIKDVNFINLKLVDNIAVEECVYDYSKLLSYKEFNKPDNSKELAGLLSNMSFDKKIKTIQTQTGEADSYLSEKLKEISISITSEVGKPATEISATLY